MSFKYHYVNDADMGVRFRVLAEGPCEFMVKSITEKDERNYPLQDNAGNSKFVAEFIVKDSRGEKGLVEENFSGGPKSSWKIKQLLDSLGIGNEFNQSGELDLQKLVNKRGRAIIYTNKYTKRDGSEGANSKVREFTTTIGPGTVATMPVYAPPVRTAVVNSNNPPVGAYSDIDQSIPF